MSNGHRTLFDQLVDPSGPLAQRERMMADQRRREVLEEINNYLTFKTQLGIAFDEFDRQTPDDPSLPPVAETDPETREGIISWLANTLYEPVTEMFQKLQGPGPIGVGATIGSAIVGQGDPLPDGVTRSEYNELLGRAEFYDIPDAAEMSPRQLENIINLRRAGLREEGVTDLSDIPVGQRHLLVGTSAALGGLETVVEQAQKLPFLGNFLSERRTIQESEQWLAKVREGLTADLDPVQQVVMEQAGELGSLATYLYAGAAIWRALGTATATPSLALVRSGHLGASAKMAAGSRMARIAQRGAQAFRQGVIPGAGTGFILEGGGDAPLEQRAATVAAYGAFGGIIGLGGPIAGSAIGAGVFGAAGSIFTEDPKKLGALMLAGGFLGFGGIGILGRAIARSFPRPSQTLGGPGTSGPQRPPRGLIEGGTLRGEPVGGRPEPTGPFSEVVPEPGLLPAPRGRLPAPRPSGEPIVPPAPARGPGREPLPPFRDMAPDEFVLGAAGREPPPSGPIVTPPPGGLGGDPAPDEFLLGAAGRETPRAPLIEGLNTREAAAEADALTRQRVTLESGDLDHAVSRPYLDDYDASRAAANSRPDHIAVLRNVEDQRRMMWRAANDASPEALMPHNFRFVEHKSGRTDAFISRGESITTRHRDQYRQYGVFEGQFVEHNGNQLRVSDFHEDGFVTVEEPGSNWEMQVHVDDLIPSMWGEEPTMLDMPFVYAEIVADAQTSFDDPVPVEWTDEAMNERVPQVLQNYFEANGITSPVERAAIEAYVDQHRLDDIRFEHAPDETVEMRRQNLRAAEAEQHARDVGDYQAKRSLEEIAVNHGYEWHPSSPALPPGHTGRLLIDEGHPFNEALEGGVTQAFRYEFDGTTPSESGFLEGRINRNTGEIHVLWTEVGGKSNALGLRRIRDHATELDRQLRAKGFEPTTIKGFRVGGARKNAAMRQGTSIRRIGADPDLQMDMQQLIRSKGKGGKLVQAEKAWISPDKVVYARRYDESREVTSRSFQIKAREPSEAHQVAAREMVEVLQNVVPEGETPILIPLPGRQGDIAGNGPLALEIQRLIREQGGDAGVVPILAKHPGESQLARRQKGKAGQGPDGIQMYLTDVVSDVGALLEQPNLFLLDNAVVTGASARAAQQALGKDIPVLAYVRAEPPVVEELPFESEEAAREFLNSQERTPPDLDPMGSVSADIMEAPPGGHPESLGPTPAPTFKALKKNLDRSAKLIAQEAQNEEPLWTGGFAGVGPQAPPPAPPTPPGGGGGGGLPPGGPPSPQLPPGRSEGDLGFGELLTELQKAAPRDYAVKARAMDNFFARWFLARQPWYARLDRILARFAEEQGFPRPPSLEKATSDVMQGVDISHSKMRPWIDEVNGILANFRVQHLSEGTAARAMVRPEVAQEAGFKPREIEALSMLRDWERRMQTEVFGRPVGSVFDEIVALRTFQAKMTRDDPFKAWAEQLPDEMKWVSDHFRRTRLQGKNVDIRHLVTAYTRGMFFEKHVGPQWVRALRLTQEAHQAAQGTEMENAFVTTLGLLDHIRHGIDPSTDAAVRVLANVARDLLKVPVTDAEIYRAMGGTLGLMYRALIGLDADIVFRDGSQFLFTGAELGYMWAGRALKRLLDPRTRAEVLQYGIDNGTLELGRVQIPVAEIFGSEPMIGGEPEFQGMQQAVRETARHGVQAVENLLPRFLRKGITDTPLDPLWAFSRAGMQWNRALAGEMGRLKATDALSRLESFDSNDALLEAAGMSHYDEPIRQNFLDLLQQGDTEGAIRLAAQNAANSQHRYGTLETSHGIREHGMFGKFGSVFATFTMQYAHRMWWNLAPERLPEFLPLVGGRPMGGGGRSFASKVKFAMRYAAAHGAITAAIGVTGWEALKKWQWVRSLNFPIAWPIQTAINLIQAGGAFMAEEVFDEPPTPEQRAGRAALGIRPMHEMFNPIQGGINTFRGVNRARSPRELARFLLTGEEGPSDVYTNYFEQDGPGSNLQFAPEAVPRRNPEEFPWNRREDILSPFFDTITGPKGGQ